jgi:vancomycin resistance protein VanJ
MKQEQASQPARPVRSAGKQRRRRRGPGALLIVSTTLYVLALLGVSLANIIGPERWWPAGINLYLPQWPWLLPCALFLPWYLLRAPKWCWVPILLAAWVAGPIMGFSAGFSRWSPRPPGARLRVMTYNVKWGDRDAEGVVSNVARADPDLLVMQHSGGSIERNLTRLKRRGWFNARLSEYTVLSRYPILETEAKPLTREAGDQVLRCVVRMGSKRIVVYTVHFMTPRPALASVAGRGAEAASDLEANARVRERQASRLAEHLKAERGPVIVAGDLNSPVQSQACRALLRCGLRDAFSEAGLGYGYTYGQSTAVGRPYVRIDHILVSPEWRVLGCREGSPRGSDHSPVTADLLLPDSPKGADR